MGEFANLPDGRLFMTNGIQYGTAGYGNDSWAIGQSYGRAPLMQAWYFDPSKPSGSRWSKAGVPTVQRLCEWRLLLQKMHFADEEIEIQIIHRYHSFLTDPSLFLEVIPMRIVSIAAWFCCDGNFL